MPARVARLGVSVRGWGHPRGHRSLLLLAARGDRLMDPVKRRQR
jgi:hypothetical protein